MAWESRGKGHDPEEDVIKADYDIVATVVKVHPKCGFGYETGDRIIFNGREVKGTVCISVIQSCLGTVIQMYQDKDPKIKNIFACPDARTPVIFELEKVDKKIGKPYRGKTKR